MPERIMLTENGSRRVTVEDHGLRPGPKGEGAIVLRVPAPGVVELTAADRDLLVSMLNGEEPPEPREGPVEPMRGMPTVAVERGEGDGKDVR